MAGYKNRISNPLFRVDQEGNAAGVTTSGAYVVDQWQLSAVNDVTTQTLSRVAGTNVPYALQYEVTTGSDTSIAAGQYAIIQHRIEAYDIQDALQGTANAKDFVLSGTVTAPTTGTYCVAVRNGTPDRSYVFELSCTANTPLDFEETIPGDTTGTWPTANTRGLIIDFTIASGSTYHTTADAWQTGSFLATSNQANGLASNGNIYKIENIKLGVGEAVGEEVVPIEYDMERCQRYYEEVVCSTYVYDETGSNNYYQTISFCRKRTAPSATLVTSGISLNSAGTRSVSGLSGLGARFFFEGGFSAGLSYDIGFVYAINARL